MAIVQDEMLQTLLSRVHPFKMNLEGNLIIRSVPFFFREVFVYHQRGNDVNFSNHLKLERILWWQIEAFK